MRRAIIILLLVCCWAISAHAKRHYVNVAAVGLDNGTSWSNAFTDLSAAVLLNSSPGDTFWVVKGAYYSSMTGFWGFQLQSRVVFGGFEGTETLLSQRNWVANKTIIVGSNGYNTAISIEGDSRLDGFTITSFTSPAAQDLYGGIRFYAIGTSVLENCIVTNLYAVYPVMIQSSIINPTYASILNCQFIDNHGSLTRTASGYGNGTTIQTATMSTTHIPTIVNIDKCLFANNSGELGGAIRLNDSATMTINRSVFYGNEASISGGAIYDRLGRLRVLNSLIVGNKAPLGGAHYGISGLGGYRNFTHCTIANNWSATAVAPNYAIWLSGAKDTLRNCIVWGDSTGGAEAPLPASGAFFNRNVIKGAAGFAASTNTYTFNPLFVAPGKVSAAPFLSLSNYDYHLAALSDARDTGVNLGLGAPFNLDLENNARVLGPLPDLGAYEWKACPWHNVTITTSGPTTFCQPDSVILTASGNPNYYHSYQWNAGPASGNRLTVRASGIYKVVVIDSLGCNASATVTVNAVATPTPVITRTGSKLSVPAVYASYQWFLGGSPISGATSAIYSPVSNGSYIVRVTTVAGNCPGTSAAYNVLNLSVGSQPADQSVHIYPNPGDGRFTVLLDGFAADVTLSVYSVTGRQVFLQWYDHAPGHYKYAVDLHNPDKGVYFFRVVSGDLVIIKRVAIF